MHNHVSRGDLITIGQNRAVEGDGVAVRYIFIVVVVVHRRELDGRIQQHQFHRRLAVEGEAVALERVVDGPDDRALSLEVFKAEGGKRGGEFVAVDAEEQRIAVEKAADRGAIRLSVVFEHEARHAFHGHAGIAAAVNVVGDGIDAAVLKGAVREGELRLIRARLAQRGRVGKDDPVAVRVQLVEGEGVVVGVKGHILAVFQRVGSDVGRPRLRAARLGGGVLRLDADDVGVVRQHAEAKARRARGGSGQVVAKDGVVVPRLAGGVGDLRAHGVVRGHDGVVLREDGGLAGEDRLRAFPGGRGVEAAGEQARRRATGIVDGHVRHFQRAVGDEHQRQLFAASAQRAAREAQRAFAAEGDEGVQEFRAGAQGVAVEVERDGLICGQQQREALAEGKVALQRDGIARGARQAQRLRKAIGGGDVAQFAGVGGGREGQRPAVQIGEQYLRAVADLAQGHGGKPAREAQQHFPTVAIRDVAVACEGEGRRFEAGGGRAVFVRIGEDGDAFQTAQVDHALRFGVFEAQRALRRGQHVARGGEQRAGRDVGGGDGDIARDALDGHGLARHLAAVLHDLLP